MRRFKYSVDAKAFGPTITANLIRYDLDSQNVLPALTTALIPNALKFDTTLSRRLPSGPSERPATYGSDDRFSAQRANRASDFAQYYETTTIWFKGPNSLLR
jgi:hypothetical protein